ncbi:uncharacterized protein LOC128677017 isoform X2 [Plodia interpunctella]|uniref:uncharacterized protein LOC128677017 isoform X2 n=1 Tax=Plodia interpunctella TaxID=58824 RepID=UPI0023687416|nr:uncharacterized protein LOC128677017 isoform X2 [Plodia interpunctella]
MTILLYDHCELEERSSKTLKVWKAWHLILYICAAVSGIANYTLLHKSQELVNYNCIFFPRTLEFHLVEHVDYVQVIDPNDADNTAQINSTVAAPYNFDAQKTKRETASNETSKESETSEEIYNRTIMTGNVTHRVALYASRTLFGEDGRCQFAEYMPLMSTVLAAVWLTFFTMCPSGGRVRTGLPQPWRILAPALVCALVMVGLTGHSFTTTNAGIHAFCAAFEEYTNSTNCSPVNDFLEPGWNTTWGFGPRVEATRAASAAVWVSWACAAAIFLARCLTAPDFQVKRTKIVVTSDPDQKITPFLKKQSTRSSRRSERSSPSKRDNVSTRSEPTATSELATVSVEPGLDSAPSSLLATPRKNNGEMIEMTYTY